MGEPLAGASDATLYFVDHQQPAAFVAQATQRAHVVEIRDLDAAFALQHLDPDSANARIGGGRPLDRADVVVRDADESARQRLEALACLVAGRGRERCERASVPGALHDDRLRLGLAVLVAIQAHELQCAFVGLGSGVAEEDFLQTRQRAQAVGELFLLAHTVDVRRVDQSTDLLSQRGDQARMRVAEAVDGDASQRIEIFFALLVEEPCTLAVGEGDREPVVGVHQVRHRSHSVPWRKEKTRRWGVAAAFAGL